MTKSQDLIRRKTLLRTQLLQIQRGIAEETSQLDDSNLIKFIKDGVLTTQDGHKLQRLQKDKMALLRIERGLNKQIMMARGSERQKTLKTAEAAVQKVELERHRLGAKRLSLLKQAQAIGQQLNTLKVGLLEKEIEAKPSLHDKLTDYFKLIPGGLEKFLEEHYIQNPEELEKARQRAIESNRAGISPGVKPLGFSRSNSIELFWVTFMKDSGVIVELKEKGPSWAIARDRKDFENAFLGGEKK